MAIARQLFGAVMLGLLVRAWRGFSMLDPLFFIPFACLSALLAAPMFLDMRRREPASPVLRHVARAVASACGSVGVMLAVPLLVLNYPWYETWFLPQWPTVLDAIVLSLASATATVAATGLLLKWVAPRTVKWALRVLVFAGLVLWRFSPERWGNSTLITVLGWGITTTALSVAAALVLADAGLLYLLVRISTLAYRTHRSA